jgi:hypothetical protein
MPPHLLVAEFVDRHIAKSHPHLSGAWQSIRRNEPDDASRQAQELWQQIIDLRRRLLDRTKSVDLFEPHSLVLARPVGFEVARPSAASITRPAAVFSLAPLVDSVGRDAIPERIRYRVERFLDPARRAALAPESEADVARRITKMVGSGELRTDPTRFRQLYDEAVMKRHGLPAVLRGHLRLGGTATFDGRPTASFPSSSVSDARDEPEELFEEDQFEEDQFEEDQFKEEDTPHEPSPTETKPPRSDRKTP